MYKSILVPLDGSELAEAILPEIEKLAKVFNSKIVLVRVTRVHVFPGKDPTDAQVKATRRAESYIVGIKERLASEGFEVGAHVCYGDTAEEILNLGNRTDIDIIAMSTHGRSGLGRWLLGSVAEKILRHSEKPVLLLRSGSVKTGEM